MLLKPVSILLLFSLLTANFADLLVVSGFEMNRKYIAAALCENKDKPQLHCEGKCYLMKKLKQAQEKEQKQERQAQKIQLLDAVIVQPIAFKRFSIADINFHIPLTTGMPQSIRNSIFHPPQVV